MHISTRDATGHNTIAGKDLAAARTRAGLSQKQLAELLHHSERIVQKWESTHVAEGKEPLVRAVLGDYLPQAPGVVPLSSYSMWALLMEIGRRFDEFSERGWKRRSEDHDSSGGAPATTPGAGPRARSDPLGAEEANARSDEDGRPL